MATQIPATPSPRRLPPTVSELSTAIDRALRVSGMTPTRFGVGATNDRMIVSDLRRAKRVPRAETRLRLLATGFPLHASPQRRVFKRAGS